MSDVSANADALGFTEAIKGLIDGKIRLEEGEALEEAVDREFARRCRALSVGGIQVSHDADLPFNEETVVEVSTTPEGATALINAGKKAMVAEKMVTQLTAMLRAKEEESDRLNERCDQAELITKSLQDIIVKVCQGAEAFSHRGGSAKPGNVKKTKSLEHPKEIERWDGPHLRILATPYAPQDDDGRA